MKYTTIPQVRFISGRTPEEAAAEFNLAMRELAPLRPTYEREGTSFYIYFNIEMSEAEDIVEEHQLKGEYHYCRECNNCVRDLNRFGEVDKRKRHATCTYLGERVRLDSRVCEHYYE